MVGIKSLAVELLDIIFQYVTTPACRRGYHVELSTIPSRALFPFNVSSVCPLWLEILKSHPRYWQRVVIDVADDPAPFLDTFSLFTDETNTPLDLIVLSSAPNIATDLENRRARVIFKRLGPSITRYATISFHLVWQSSLPSAANILVGDLDLKELHLTCTTYDLYGGDLNFDFNSLSYDPESPPPDVILTDLRKLSLTGYHFLDLCRAGQLEAHQSLQLSVHHFEFQKHQSESSIQSETFLMFLTALDTLSNNDPIGVTLSDLSLDYRPSTKLLSKYNLSVSNLLFDNVSSDFILAFFSSVTLADEILGDLTFRKCLIPFLAKHTGLSHSIYLVLQLEDISYETPGAISLTGMGQQVQDSSICNAIEAFSPMELRVLRCDGLTDSVFDWLTIKNDTEVEAPSLKFITIHDCTGFTPWSLLSIALNRYKMHYESRDNNSIAEVEVQGKGPALSKEDISCFLNDENASATIIKWSVECDDDVGEDFVTEFRTHVTPEVSTHDDGTILNSFFDI